jgi:NAD+ diphosphatase
VSGSALPGSPLLPDLPLARSVVDRAAEHRTDESWLAEAWESPKVQVVRTSKGTAAVAGDPVSLDLDVRPDVKPEQRIFLGVDADVPFFGVEVEEGDESFRSLREIGMLLGARDTGLLVHAIAIANWHATHTHCPRCGAPTRMTSGGHTRMCDVDGSEHYPRTDPAVIMAVVDDDDRLLLGHQAIWPEKRFSTLAGFVEPGESLEHAVRREVAEEVGLEIGDVGYLGSQAWPFPASLMLGFVAHATTTEVHRHDGEIAEARWFTRDGLLDAVRTGEVLLSPPVSIARRLIEHWYGQPIEDAQQAWR